MSTLLDTLTKLVVVDSRTAHESPITPLLQTMLERAGFMVEYQQVSPGRSNLYAVKNSQSKSGAILFYGHQDTVAPVHDWNGDPFELRREDDRLYGLGAFDMKGGIAAFLEATCNTGAYVKIFLAVDEEGASEGAWYAVENNASFFQDVSLVISAEPSLTGRSSHITVGRTGRFLFDMTFKGRSAHLASYQNGVDAIEQMQTFLANFYAQRFELFDEHGSTAQIRSVQSEVTGMSVPELATCQVEILADCGKTIGDMRAKLQQIAGDAVSISIAPRKTPYLSGYHNAVFPYQEALERIIERIYKQPITYIERRSVGDDNVLASSGIPVITWGPEGGNAHAAQEWVSLASLEKLVRGYQLLLDHIS